MSENTGVTVTFKAGQGFEAPWIVIHAENTDDALRQVDSGNFATLAERTVSAAEFFRAGYTAKRGFPNAQTEAQQSASVVPVGGFAPGDPTAPQPQSGWSQQGSRQTAAPADAPQGGKTCTHGAMVYRTGTSAKGPWRAFFCPTPKNTPGQCKAEFI